MQSNVRSSYQDFRILIDNIQPSDYIYMRLIQEMASIGFFNLAELAMSKIQDDEVASFIGRRCKKILLSVIQIDPQRPIISC